ncbi:hypothetical protein NQ317_007586 [Molorchus minor]|uniref:Uncharacterized protein n=1 Tax=Molorchus minor TaxID=1323400 RepID=A0ABQ9IUN9_9CUCU|nr:hypothetical protein NQ317_007586 [Molorchus minor]
MYITNFLQITIFLQRAKTTQKWFKTISYSTRLTSSRRWLCSAIAILLLDKRMVHYTKTFCLPINPSLLVMESITATTNITGQTIRMLRANLWCGMINDQSVGLFVLKERFTGARYLEYLENELINLLDDVSFRLRQKMYFQEYGAPAHLARDVINNLA